MENVAVDDRPPLRVVRLDAGPRNALRLESVGALRRALAPAPGIETALLLGREDGFSVGLDDAVLAGAARDREALLLAMGELLRDLYGSPLRLVAACAGHAVAAGAMLLLTADWRIGADRPYRIGYSEPSVGMPLPELPVRLAEDRLDRRRHVEATLLGRLFGPAEAVEVGFLDEVAPPAELEAVALERAGSLGRVPIDAYRGTLRAVRGRTLAHMDATLAEQRARFEAAATGAR